MHGGVYRIVNSTTGDSYIGRAASFAKRRATHWAHLRAGRHANVHLQRAWDKYGEAAFEFKLLVICSPEYAETLEQSLLDSKAGEYNISTYAASSVAPGSKRPPEIGEAVKASWTEARRAAQAERNRSPAMRDRVRSPEERAKIGAASRGERTLATCIAISEGKKEFERMRLVRRALQDGIAEQSNSPRGQRQLRKADIRRYVQ